MSPNNTINKGLVPQLKEGLYRLRNEVTSEVESENYEETEKENLSSRENGSLSKEMVKRRTQD